MNEKLPKHVAIVMDGNGRWAQQRGLLRVEGHRAGVESVRTVIKHCIKREISILSLFAFSSENWLRPEAEISFLMSLFLEALQKEVQELHANGIRLCFSGNRKALSARLCEQMLAAEQLTATNKKLIVHVAMNYGGRWDITQAIQKIVSEVQKNELGLEDINETLVSTRLSTAALTEPDLFIRTSGEQRISNFFLWQLAYTELYFTTTHWPDFDEHEFDKALNDYHRRQRRYGRISEQVTEGN